MKMNVTIIILLFPFFIFAQVKKKKQKTIKSDNTICINDYFCEHNLCIDSAETPYLYYQVYDWLGTKYKYSGNSKKGIDCSGFVSEMYENTYCVDLNGGSKDIWKIVKPIERAEIKEGDVLFFKIKKGQISHVGIYLGNDKFAHASVKSGVIISDLKEPYYKKYFFKAGRVLGEEGVGSGR
jgi:murein DD-endopeptidase / murein LD-carboxypeptidase